MAANEITFTIRAEDLSTPALQKIRGSIQNLHNAGMMFGRGMQSTIPSMTAWERQMSRLTTVNGLAFEAFRRFNSAVSGFFIGGAIGFVIGSVNDLTDSLIKNIVKWLDLESAATKAQRSLETIGRTQADANKQVALAAQTRIEQLKKEISDVSSVFFLYDRFFKTNHLSQTERLKLMEEEIAAMEKIRDLAMPTQEFISQAELGRRIQERARLDYEDRVREQARKLQEDLIEINRTYRAQERDDIAQEERDWEERRLTALRMFLAAKRSEVDRHTTEELAVIRRQMLETLQLEQQKYAAQMGMLTAAGSLVGAIKSQSRAIFLINKALAVASTIVFANMAATAAAAGAATIPDPTAAARAIAAGETVRRWGYINAAIIAATSLTEGFSGAFGGGGRGGGGSSLPSSSQIGGGTAAAATQRVTVDFVLKVDSSGNPLDVAIAHAIQPILAKNLQENDFQMGNIRLEGSRL